MLHSPLIVIKIGTNAITDKAGNLHPERLEEMVRQIVVLHQDHRIVLVSSGAVGCGKNFISKYAKKIAQQKAAAAIGNPLLMHHYQYEFSKQSDILVAQTLIEKHHFSNRTSFLQIWETFETLWKEGVIPIANENDVVCDHEIRFTDNDELATMIACGFSARQLLLGTAVEGVLDKEGNVIAEIEEFDQKLSDCLMKTTSSHGRGGMCAKLECAQKATEMGCEVVIFDGREKGALLAAHQYQTGTYCKAKSCTLSAHKRWISMGGEICGKIVIDVGALKAIRNKKSLLLVGVQSVGGAFEKGDLLGIYDETGNNLVALGRAHFGTDDLEKIVDRKAQELVQTDELVVL